MLEMDERFTDQTRYAFVSLNDRTRLSVATLCGHPQSIHFTEAVW
jgi:hypothetical protein